MLASVNKLRAEIKEQLLKGVVIPAHPLALDSSRKFDVNHQRALTKYYMAAGAGGIAVGVHTTQFEIHKNGMYESVLRTCSEAVDDENLRTPFVRVAGIVGRTDQAVREAEIASDLGYDLGLVSVVGVNDWSEEKLLERVEKILDVIPVFGFYMQPAVGGRKLSFNFWKKLADLPGVVAIKIAPFSRYETLEVVRAVANSNRREEVALYTGNDDNIVFDLITPYRFLVDGRPVEKRIVGGLLGQWAVWTKFAVSLLDQIKQVRNNDVSKGIDNSNSIPVRLLGIGAELTECNSVIFDAKNNFRGLLPGTHEILRRQGLVTSRFTLNPKEDLSPGQAEEIDRILLDHPHLHSEDDAFIKEHLDEWLR
jgi:hypothetical protein